MNTETEMESSTTSETGRDAQVPKNSETGDTGSLTGSSGQTEIARRNNLFFCTDDGKTLAVCISPTLGPALLRGLSQTKGPPSEVSAPPFALPPSIAIDNGLAGDAQIQPSTANASAQPSSPASNTDGAADVSSTRSAPDPPASPALFGALRPNSGAGIVDANAWVDGIFSSADGAAYDRDWMSNHDVNNDILDGTPSKHKLNVLVKHGAVFVDDKLCVTYHASGNPTVIQGEILPDSTSTNLSVRIAPARGNYKGILYNVQGPRDLISGMNKKYAARYDHEVSEQWKAVRLVSSSGKEYGTLFEVRQAYQVWTDEKAKWAARNRRVGSG